MPFAGIRVLSLESRRATEMETLIRRSGGVPFVAPSVKERAVEDDQLALHFVQQLEAGQFDLIICMTAVGLTVLKDTALKLMPPERLSAALRKAAIISRGPKPVGVLKNLGVPIDYVVPEPNTWKEIVDAIAPRPERRIAVQEYGRTNPELNQALERLGATVTPVALYRWELPDDLDPLREAVRRLAARDCEVILFTSSIQLDHLFDIARTLNLEAEVRQALQRDVVVASIGPVMTATLTANGYPPDVLPKHPKMWALVKAAAEESHAILTRKRSA